MVSLLDYLELAAKYRGTTDYIGFGTVAEIVCKRYGIRVEYDSNEIIVNADAETIAKIEF